MMMMMMMMMMIILMMMIIIIVIKLKGAILNFDNLLTALQTVSSTYAQVTRAQSCSDLVRHI